MNKPRDQVPIAEHEKVLAELENLKMEFSDAGGVGGLRAQIAELRSQLELSARERMKIEEENMRLKERSLEDRTRTDRVIDVTNTVAASLQSTLRLTETIFSRLDAAAMGQTVTVAPQGVDMAALANLRSGG